MLKKLIALLLVLCTLLPLAAYAEKEPNTIIPLT